MLVRCFVGFYAQQVRENPSLLRTESRVEPGGIENRIALIHGHSAEVLEGAPHLGLALGWQVSHHSSGLVDLHALGGRQALQRLGPGQPALPLRFRQLVELMKLLDLPLLVAGIEPVKARFRAQKPFLLGHRQILMLRHPFG